MPTERRYGRGTYLLITLWGAGAGRPRPAWQILGKKHQQSEIEPRQILAMEKLHGSLPNGDFYACPWGLTIFPGKISFFGRPASRCTGSGIYSMPWDLYKRSILHNSPDYIFDIWKMPDDRDGEYNSWSLI